MVTSEEVGIAVYWKFIISKRPISIAFSLKSLFDKFYCNRELTWYVDKQGAPLTEYTLRLIGSDVEHYIRKLLYDGEIQYNMNARVLNFSMGKPRVGFCYNGDDQLKDVK